MKLPQFLGNLIAKTKAFRFTRENLTVWGVAALGCLFALVLFWDGYLFYQIVVKGREAARPLEKRITLTGEEIDGVVRLLDEREQKFNEILGGAAR